MGSVLDAPETPQNTSLHQPYNQNNSMIHEVNKNSNSEINTLLRTDDLIPLIEMDDVAELDRRSYNLEELATLRFAKDMNILNLAIDKEAVKIVQHLARKLKGKETLKNQLLYYRYNKHGITSVHQVMATGNKAILEAVLIEMEADQEVSLEDGNKLVHCAAQFYEGFLPLLFLIEKFNVDLDARDAAQGSALHFAVTEGEHKNVELLI